jgi:protein pelota
MKTIKKDLKHGIITIRTDSLDDLWYLSHLVEPGDVVRGRTERKIKIGDSDARKQAVVKKTVTLTLKVEKVEFHKYSNVLRISGLIEEGPDDIPKGSHHTISVEESTVLTIIKDKWLNYQLDKLYEATTSIKQKILAVLFDREEAIIALLKTRGYELLTKFKGDVSKKGVDEKVKGNLYKMIIDKLQEYEKRYDMKNIIIASPSFWKEYLLKEMSPEMAKKCTQATISAVDESAISELMKRPELKTVLEKDKAAKEIQMVDNLLKEISKDNACYGIKDCKEKVGIGAVKELFVTDNFILELREKDNYKDIDKLMRDCENADGKIHIISTDDAVKKLDGLGGVAGVLRWKIS